MVSPPILVSKGNVMIGYNAIYEYAALPDVERIVAAVRRSMSTKQMRSPIATGTDRGQLQPEPTSPAPAHFVTTRGRSPATAATAARTRNITVPIMGEGIRNAKVVSLLKNPGDTIALDDPLCEVETDKAVYPIESPLPARWVNGKRKLANGRHRTGDRNHFDGIRFGIGLVCRQFETAAEVSAHTQNGEQPGAATDLSQRMTPKREEGKAGGIEPAFSPTIVRRLGAVVPANLQIDARWDGIEKCATPRRKNRARMPPRLPR